MLTYVAVNKFHEQAGLYMRRKGENKNEKKKKALNDRGRAVRCRGTKRDNTACCWSGTVAFACAEVVKGRSAHTKPRPPMRRDAMHVHGSKGTKSSKTKEERSPRTILVALLWWRNVQHHKKQRGSGCRCRRKTHASTLIVQQW